MKCSTFPVYVAILLCASIVSAQDLPQQKLKQDAQFWVDTLSLTQNPVTFNFVSQILEYKSDHNTDDLPPSLPAGSRRSLAETRYILTKAATATVFHKVPSESLIHWLAGSTLTLRYIDNDTGTLQRLQLGRSKNNFIGVIKADTWLITEVRNPGKHNYALYSVTAIPGTGQLTAEQRANMKANRQDLIDEFPKVRKAIITQYTEP